MQIIRVIGSVLTGSTRKVGEVGMTHSMTQAEKQKLLEEIRELTLSDILQQEDMVEIFKITQKACNRVLSEIDGLYPARSEG